MIACVKLAHALCVLLAAAAMNQPHQDIPRHYALMRSARSAAKVGGHVAGSRAFKRDMFAIGSSSLQDMIGRQTYCMLQTRICLVHVVNRMMHALVSTQDLSRMQSLRAHAKSVPFKVACALAWNWVTCSIVLRIA